MRTFTVVANTWKPCLIVKNTGGVYSIEGAMNVMLTHLSRRLNFTYNVIPSYDGTWGSFLPNKTFTGIVGMLNRTQADMTVSPTAMTPERFEAVKFSNILFFSYNTILVGWPEHMETQSFAFFKIFQPMVWISILVCALMVSVVEWRMEKTHPLSFHLWTRAFENMIQKGSDYVPRTFHGQLVIGVWLLSVLVVSSGFSGVLMSSLTIPDKPNIIDSLEDLALSKNVEPFVAKDCSQQEYFRLTPKFPESEIWKRMQHEGNRLVFQNVNMSQIVEKVQLGKHVLVEAREFSLRLLHERMMRKQFCHFHLVPYNFHFMALAFRKDTSSEFMDTVNKEMQIFDQSHIFHKMVDREIREAPKCLNPPETSRFQDLAVKHIRGIFYVWFIGGAAGILVFVLEIVYFVIAKIKAKKCRLESFEIRKDPKEFFHKL